MSSQVRTLRRDIVATAIPSGEPIRLSRGATVLIRQALGGTYTATTARGRLVRIDGQDADAIGEPPPARAPIGMVGDEAEPGGRLDRSLAASGSARAAPDASLEELAWLELRTCFDPEIPVDIVELGLVRSCTVTELPEGGQRIEVRFTLTAPGCGMGDVLRRDVEAKLARLPGVSAADVRLELEPPWNPSMMSEAARLALGFL